MDVRLKGFTKYAQDAAAGSGDVSAENQKFLAAEFDGARERMTNLASTIGTAGSFVLVLVALLISFAKGTDDQTQKLVDASAKQALQAAACSDEAETAKSTRPSPPNSCSALKLEQASQAVERAQDEVGDLSRLNKLQAVAGGLVLLGFIFGLAGVLTNPVPGPNARKNEENHVGTAEAWTSAIDRLGVKKAWIIASLVVEAGAVIAIGAIGIEIFN